MNVIIKSGLEEIGYAKLNIALHVRKRLSNGYHELETLFAFLDRGDLVSATIDEHLKLTISGLFGKGLGIEDNLVLAAAKLLQNEFNVSVGAELHLTKNLPVASGLGGGSADAAATLRLLNRLWDLNLSISDLQLLSKPLGADVPACISSEISIGQGIGQDLIPINDDFLSGLHILLANPLEAVSTKEVFERWDGTDLGGLDTKNMTDILSHGRNDLQPAAISLEDSIAPLLKAIEQTNPITAKLSGSGATCFGLYKNSVSAEAAERIIQSSIEKIWTLTGSLR